MSTSKHPKPGQEPDPLPADDLANDPGIGGSRGTSGADRDDIAGATTVEGDTANDTTEAGGIDPDQRGRTNK